MPRDALGVVTLVVGNPVVNGTAISADVHNATVADLASMIEDSLSRSGKGGMDSPMQFADGTAATPSITFSSQTTTGFFRTTISAVLGIGISFAGSVKAFFSAALAHFYTPVLMDSTLEVTGAITATAGVSGITRANLPAVGQRVAASSTSNFASAAAAFTAVTNATITITSTGRPIMLMLQQDGTGSDAYVGTSVVGAATPTVVSAIYRWQRTGTSSADIGRNSVTATGAASVALGCRVPPAALNHLDVVGAGTYTYALQVYAAADSWGYCYNCFVVAYEL